MILEAGEANSRHSGRAFVILLSFWLALAAMTTLLARQNSSVPGLYYDEALFAGMAKDFVTGHVHGQHMPDHEVVTFLGDRISESLSLAPHSTEIPNEHTPIVDNSAVS